MANRPVKPLATITINVTRAGIAQVLGFAAVMLVWFATGPL